MSFWNKKKRIFLDYASITPVDESVSKVMEECQREVFANPSALYAEGLLAKEKMTEARKIIAKILNTQKDHIYFTGSGTESNNLVLLGVFEAAKKKFKTPHIVTTNIEHSSILEVCKEIEKRGGEVTYMPVDENGLVNPKDISSALKETTVLVSVMYVNNEIGTIQPIKEIGRIVKEYKLKNNIEHLFFHTDACQAPLYLSVDVLKLGVDMMTLDGIKIYGPRCFGMLYVKPTVSIEPIIFGGGQEKGLRSGTENVSAIIGFAKAFQIADEMRKKESERLTVIRDYAIEKILKNFPNATLNGLKENRLPNNINVCFPGLDAEFAVISLDVLGIAVSYSSSCRTLAENSSSYVVEALGKSECSLSSLRFTLGRESTKGDIDALVVALQKIVK